MVASGRFELIFVDKTSIALRKPVHDEVCQLMASNFFWAPQNKFSSYLSVFQLFYDATSWKFFELVREQTFGKFFEHSFKFLNIRFVDDFRKCVSEQSFCEFWNLAFI